MSELINKQSRSDFRWHLLTTVSALSLVVTLSGHAEAADKPSVWVELGGQLERIDGGAGDPFQPPFTQLSPTPGPYSPISPDRAQKPAIYSYGAEGKITVEPDGSDWKFSAAIRYGRSNNNKHIHQQTIVTSQYPNQFANFPGQAPIKYKTSQKFADIKAQNSESHAVADFQAGRDVGLGLFGRGSSSSVGFGVRTADFTTNSTVNMIARPNVAFHGGPTATQHKYKHAAYHTDYKSISNNKRSFEGIGPSLSWEGYVPVVDGEDGAITFDWGANAAALFGRQKAKGTHQETARYYDELRYIQQPPYGVVTRYRHLPLAHDRSRSVVVPNVGGLVGISFRYAEAKVSFGYRADLFFGAMDMGVDQHHTESRNFYGPFATISVGLGG